MAELKVEVQVFLCFILAFGHQSRLKRGINITPLQPTESRKLPSFQPGSLELAGSF